MILCASTLQVASVTFHVSGVRLRREMVDADASRSVAPMTNFYVWRQLLLSGVQQIR